MGFIADTWHLDRATAVAITIERASASGTTPFSKQYLCVRVPLALVKKYPALATALQGYNLDTDAAAHYIPWSDQVNAEMCRDKLMAEAK